jgi:hypothetical protein
MVVVSLFLMVLAADPFQSQIGTWRQFCIRRRRRRILWLLRLHHYSSFILSSLVGSRDLNAAPSRLMKVLVLHRFFDSGFIDSCH